MKAMANTFYQTLVHAGAPLGVLGSTARTLRSANGTRISVLGCSHCVVSFLGLQVEFPVLVCDLATGTDAIIGTDVLGSVLPHTLDIKNGLLFTEGGASLQLHRRDSALSGCVYAVGHCSIPAYSEAVLHCWSSDAIQWFIRWTNTVRGEYRSDCRHDTGGSVTMEGTGPRVKFQSRYRRGGSILRGGNDSSSFCHPVRYGATGLATKGR